MSVPKFLNFENYVDLMRKHVEDARKMSDVLRSVPVLERRADRMRNCSTISRGRFCPSCKSWHTTQASLCRDRLCPNCGWALSRARASAIASALSDQKDVHVFAVVLTVRNCSLRSLSDCLSDLLHACSRFTRSRSFKKAFIGYSRNVEIKLNERDVHPHIHMLALSHYKRPIDKRSLSDLWRHALQVDYTPVTWIKEAFGKDTSDAVYECVKYTIKASEWLNMSPQKVLTFAEAIHGKKLFASGGMLAKLETVSVPDAVPLLCDKCGTRTVDFTLDMNEVMPYVKHP